ncbi:MAG: CHAT domain-containing protein [Gammaproteobacteria bacterium]
MTDPGLRFRRGISQLLEALAMPVAESRDQYLLSRANLHAQIGLKYFRRELPWAIPHYEAARRAWEELRSRVSDPRERRNMLDRASYQIYYPLILAYLRIARPGGATTGVPPYPEEDAAQQMPFARDELPGLLAGAATARAFEVLEAVRARSYADRLARAGGEREARPALCGEIPRLLERPQGGGHAALAAWLCVDDRTHLFLFKPGESSPRHFEQAVGIARLEELVALFNDAFAAHDLASDKVDMRQLPLWPALQALAPLVAPLADELDPGTLLVLLPHGPLHTLPLGLIEVGPERRPLLDRHPLAWASSAAHLRVSRAMRARLRETAAAGPMEEILAVGVGTEEDRQVADFRPLRAWESAATAPASLRAAPLLWEQATLRGLQSHARGKRFCAITCHGYYQALDTQESGLHLWHDEYVDLPTLEALRLPFEVVFCNACRSGRQRTLRSNEPTGLPMAWSLAGAPSVVGSIWDVSYDAGTGIMRAFFVELLEARNMDSPALALQQAVRKLRRRFPSPFHWGGWILYGAP